MVIGFLLLILGFGVGCALAIQLLRAVGILLAWLLVCLIEAALQLGVVLTRGLLAALALAGRLLWAAARRTPVVAEFLFLLALEWWRGERDEDDAPGDYEDEEEEQEEEPAPVRDPCEEAMEVLGLAAGFTRTALNRAWREAILAAHPDRGGAVEQAQAVNAARDLLARHHGWK